MRIASVIGSRFIRDKNTSGYDTLVCQRSFSICEDATIHEEFYFLSEFIQQMESDLS